MVIYAIPLHRHELPAQLIRTAWCGQIVWSLRIFGGSRGHFASCALAESGSDQLGLDSLDWPEHAALEPWPRTLADHTPAA